MATWGRMALICTAALAVASASAHVSAQTTLKDRVVSAIESVEAACADDINKFCGHVTRGEGRLLLCMQAHDDQLSFRCQFGLYRASRHLDNALNRVERIADACWGDIETQCKDAQSIGQCVLDKAPALSQACQTVVAGIRQALQGVASLKGLPAFSADGKNLGQVVDVVRGPDGKVQSVRIDVGRFLGMGDRVVTINRGAFEQLADRINLRLSGDDVRALPESK